MVELTKKEIMKTFIEILDEKSFDKITIKEITEKCKINRNTFYYHYEDIFDLVDKLLKNKSNEIINICKNTEKSTFAKSIKYITENKKAISNLYNSKICKTFEKYIYITIEELIRNYKNIKYREIILDPNDEKLIIKFFAGAISNCIYYWLKSGMKSEPIEVINKMLKILELSFAGVIKNYDRQKKQNA